MKNIKNIIMTTLIISNLSTNILSNITYAGENLTSQGINLSENNQIASSSNLTDSPKAEIDNLWDDGGFTPPPPHKETKTIELGTIKLNVAANGKINVILSKKSEIREKIKTFAEEKTGKKIRTPYYLNDLEYDKEKNMFYYKLIKKENNEKDTFSYYYSNERAENPEKYNINTLIEDVKRNNPEITNIEVLSTRSLPFGKTSEDNIDDYYYSSEEKRYVLANVTENGITTETKIIFREQIPRGYDLFKINENDFKTRILSEETKNKINEILSKYNNNIYYDKYTYALASDKLETNQNDFIHYISINAYNKDTNKTELKKYIVEKPNFSENINVDNLKINDKIFYFNDNDLKNLLSNYNKIYFERQNKNNQNAYKLFFENRNDSGISTILEKLNKNKSENEKISIYDVIKINKDSDIYLILKLNNNELYTIKFSKFNFPNIKIDVSGNQLTDKNRHQINKVLKHLYNYNDIYYFKDLDVINENGKISLKFKGNFYNKDIESTIRLNKLNNENFEIINPEDIPENDNENLAKLVEIGNINEKDSSDTYNVATFDVDQNFDGYATRTDRIPYYEADSRYYITLKENINDIIDEYAKEYIANKLGKRIFVVSENSIQAVHYDKELKKFYKEYQTDDESLDKYRIYINPVGKDYYFIDVSKNTLNLKDEKDIEKLKIFMKNEYGFSDIEIKNKNVLEDDNQQKYVEATVKKENGNIENIKIYFQIRNYVYVDDLKLKNTNISMKELNDKKLTEETFQKINNELKELVNDNPLYSNQNVYLDDYTIYENKEKNVFGKIIEKPLYQIKVHYKNNQKDYFINIKLTSNEKIDDFSKSYFRSDEELESFLKQKDDDIYKTRLDIYDCLKKNTNSAYFSKNGKFTILDYINLKINKSLYADNLRVLDVNGKPYIVADLKDKITNNIVDTYVIEPQTIYLIDKVFLDNINKDNLKLTEQNKKELEKIILHHFVNGIDKIDINNDIIKDENNFLFIEIKVTFKNGYSFTDYIQLFTAGKYQSNIFKKPNSNPVSSCPPTGSWALELPEYGENCSKHLKIIIPNIDDIPNEENCIPNKPNEPVTPSNIPSNPKPNGGGITPKQNKPNISNTPNKPSESTPVTIINKDKSKNDIDESQLATTLPKQDIPQSEITRNIKTGDIIFVINMTMIFTIFILTTYINFRKYKIFKTHKKD